MKLNFHIVRMKEEKMDRDFELILSLINEHSGKITWYPLARKTKLNIKGVLNDLSEKGYIASSFVNLKEKDLEYYSITELGVKYLEKLKPISL